MQHVIFVESHQILVLMQWLPLDFGLTLTATNFCVSIYDDDMSPFLLRSFNIFLRGGHLTTI